jgi:MSHA pilin protein MshC
MADRRADRSPRGLPRGFTMIELIVVMIMVGILAVTVMPRFAEQSAFQERGFQDETRTLLRFAQKTAIAQRRNVCVALNATGVTLRIDNSTPADGSCDIALAPPAAPRGGNGLTPSIASFNFRPLGDTDQSANITAAIAGTTITVDFKTGYVF